jgi:hypothetical protein
MSKVAALKVVLVGDEAVPRNGLVKKERWFAR